MCLSQWLCCLSMIIAVDMDIKQQKQKTYKGSRGMMGVRCVLTDVFIYINHGVYTGLRKPMWIPVA